MSLRFTLLLISLLTTLFLHAQEQPPQQRPNILWITVEDISPHLGCYGDDYAYTPTLDSLAARGLRFTNAYASASVCTPARSSIITGRYASTLGSQHLRGEVPLSNEVDCFTEDLRAGGYYCANFNKTDYNFPVPAAAWDHNGSTTYDSVVSHYLTELPHDTPFFCVFNIFDTHQSQTRYDSTELRRVNNLLPPEARHDPALAPLPPYYPDTREVRNNVAALHTQITRMDRQVAEILRQLDSAGLAENTIIVFYSDHGDGLPRHKRWLYHSGTRVPMIAYFPPQYQDLAPAAPGDSITDLINFIDLAPTTLALAGLEVPEDLPGTVFLGPDRGERPYTFAILDRIDEVYEFSRSVSDGRYQYLRHFEANRPQMQWSNYSEITPIRQELRRLDSLGELDSLTGWLMADHKPVEELYDLATDPHQVRNLAADPDQQQRLREMKTVLFDWMIASRDLSLLPEPYARELAGDRSPMDVFADTALFPVARILSVVDLKGRGVAHFDELTAGLSDPQPGVRYWSARGLAMLDSSAAQSAIPVLEDLLDDEVVSVRIAAAEALLHLGHSDAAVASLGEALKHSNIITRIYAAIALLGLDEVPPTFQPYLAACRADPPTRIDDANFVTYLRDALVRVEGRYE